MKVDDRQYSFASVWGKENKQFTDSKNISLSYFSVVCGCSMTQKIEKCQLFFLNSVLYR